MNASLPKISENIKCNPAWPYWLPVLLYAGVIFYLSSRQSVKLPLFPYADKVFHTVLYTGFAFFVARAVSVQWRRVTRHAMWLAFVIATVYAASDEWHQYYVPTRSCDVMDWVADMVGSALGILVYVMFNFWLVKKYEHNHSAD